MENLFEQIKKANDKMPTIKLQGKDYVQVKDRIVAFRSIFPNGKIKTYPTFTDNYVLFEAEIYDGEGKQLANAHARGLLNRDKAIEKTESASLGRALAFLGLGTSDSIASYEEMEDMEEGSGIFDEDIEKKKKLVNLFNTKLNEKSKADVLNMFRVKTAEELKADTIADILKKNGVIL